MANSSALLLVDVMIESSSAVGRSTEIFTKLLAGFLFSTRTCECDRENVTREYSQKLSICFENLRGRERGTEKVQEFMRTISEEYSPVT